MRLLTLTALVTSALLLGANSYAAAPKPVTGLSPLPENCSETGPGTLHMNTEVQPHLAVNPRDPLHLVGAYQQDRWSSVAAQGVLTVTSFDGGRTWKRSAAAVSECTGGNAGNGGDFKRSTDSWVSVSPDGTAYLATLSMTKGFFEPGSEHAIQVTRSGNGGLTWENPVTLVRGGGAAEFNDLPAVTADPAGSRFVYVVWTGIELLSASEFTGATYLSRSTDGGRTWEPGRAIHEPGVNAQTIANKIVIRPDGSLANVFTRYSGAGDLDILVITSADRGLTWSAPVKVADLAKLGTTDPETGTPVRDGADFVQAAAGSRGDVYIAWQDSRFSSGQRDGIVLSRSADGGRTWSAPVAVNGVPQVPAFSPALAVQRDGTVGVTYYDLRDNTSDPTTLPTSYWLATSDNAGASWSEQRVATFDMAFAPKVDRPVASFYLGDYHGLAASGPFFVPLFPMAGKDSGNRTDLFTDRLW